MVRVKVARTGLWSELVASSPEVKEWLRRAPWKAMCRDKTQPASSTQHINIITYMNNINIQSEAGRLKRAAAHPAERS